MRDASRIWRCALVLFLHFACWCCWEPIYNCQYEPWQTCAITHKWSQAMHKYKTIPCSISIQLTLHQDSCLTYDHCMVKQYKKFMLLKTWMVPLGFVHLWAGLRGLPPSLWGETCWLRTQPSRPCLCVNVNQLLRSWNVRLKSIPTTCGVVLGARRGTCN